MVARPEAVVVDSLDAVAVVVLTAEGTGSVAEASEVVASDSVEVAMHTIDIAVL